VEEILSGVWHWSAPNPSIGNTVVSSYWLDEGGVLIDPLLSDEVRIEWFEQRPTAPAAIVLANRHHYRSSGELARRFGVRVHVPSAGLHAFSDSRPVAGYDPGDELPGGLRAVAVGALSPDDSGLHLPGARALWLADTVVRSPSDPTGEIGWVPDSLMDDPERTKRELLEAFQRVLDEVEFDHLLLAHGLPLVNDGHDALERLVAAGGRTASDAF